MLSNRQARWLRRLEVVPRWSVVPMTRRQSVAEHSFHTTTLVLWLCGYHARRDERNFIRDVVLYAHTHDIKEAKYGDHPSPSKALKAVDAKDQVHVVLKCADILEALQHVHLESLSGNQIAPAYIIEELIRRLEPWWNAFEWDELTMLESMVEGKPTLVGVVEEVLSLAFCERFPHPAVEDKDCYPIK